MSQSKSKTMCTWVQVSKRFCDQVCWWLRTTWKCGTKGAPILKAQSFQCSLCELPAQWVFASEENINNQTDAKCYEKSKSALQLPIGCFYVELSLENSLFVGIHTETRRKLSTAKPGLMLYIHGMDIITLMCTWLAPNSLPAWDQIP